MNTSTENSSNASKPMLANRLNSLSIDEKVEILNNLLKEKKLRILDDFYEEIFEDENNIEIFRVKSKRMFESQEDAVEVLNETIYNLEIYKATTIDGKLLNKGDVFFAVCSSGFMNSSGYQKLVPIELIFPQDWHLSNNGLIAYSSKKECLKECKRRNVLAQTSSQAVC